MGYFGGDVDVTGTVTVTDVIDIKKKLIVVR